MVIWKEHPKVVDDRTEGRGHSSLIGRVVCLDSSTQNEKKKAHYVKGNQPDTLSEINLFFFLNGYMAFASY